MDVESTDEVLEVGAVLPTPDGAPGVGLRAPATRAGCAERSPRSTKRATSTSTWWTPARPPRDTKRPVLNAHCWATPVGAAEEAPRRRRRDAAGRDGRELLRLRRPLRAPGANRLHHHRRRRARVCSATSRAARQELIARLAAEGLLDQNKRRCSRRCPCASASWRAPVPRGTSDFTGQLLNSRLRL